MSTAIVPMLHPAERLCLLRGCRDFGADCVRRSFFTVSHSQRIPHWAFAHAVRGLIAVFPSLRTCYVSEKRSRNADEQQALGDAQFINRADCSVVEELSEKAWLWRDVEMLEVRSARLGRHLVDNVAEMELFLLPSLSFDRDSFTGRVVSREELALHDCSADEVWVAVMGFVFDTSPAKQFYGVGGSYSSFAGRDASCALGQMTKGTFNASHLHDNLDELDREQMEIVVDWVTFFARRYAFVGRLHGTCFDAKGNPTEKLLEWHKVARSPQRRMHRNAAFNPVGSSAATAAAAAVAVASNIDDSSWAETEFLTVMQWTADELPRFMAAFNRGEPHSTVRWLLIDRGPSRDQWVVRLAHRIVGDDASFVLYDHVFNELLHQAVINRSDKTAAEAAVKQRALLLANLHAYDYRLLAQQLAKSAIASDTPDHRGRLSADYWLAMLEGASPFSLPRSVPVDDLRLRSSPLEDLGRSVAESAPQLLDRSTMKVLKNARKTGDPGITSCVVLGALQLLRAQSGLNAGLLSLEFSGRKGLPAVGAGQTSSAELAGGLFALHSVELLRVPVAARTAIEAARDVQMQLNAIPAPGSDFLNAWQNGPRAAEICALLDKQVEVRLELFISPSVGSTESDGDKPRGSGAAVPVLEPHPRVLRVGRWRAEYWQLPEDMDAVPRAMRDPRDSGVTFHVIVEKDRLSVVAIGAARSYRPDMLKQWADALAYKIRSKIEAVASVLSQKPQGKL